MTQHFVVLPTKPGPAPGSKVSVKSRAALDRYRRTWGQQRKCVTCNRQPAISGSPHCVKHNGGGVRNVSMARLDARVLDSMRVKGLLPLELCATPVWQGLNALGMATRAPLQRQLVMLWHKRVSEPAAFNVVWRAALAAVRDHAGTR